MSFDFSAVFRRFFTVHPHERVKTLIMSFYFFSIILTVWMLKPVRNSLFLDELGAGNLRYIYMGEGLFLIGVVWAFIQFSKQVSKKALYGGVLLFFISSLLLFWFFFRLNVPYLSALFYVWAASYSIVMTTQFFTLANDIFNPLEAKRLFGIILSAGSVGGVLGGILTNQLAHVVGTENLLLVIALIIALCQALVMAKWQDLTAEAGESLDKPASLHEKQTNKDSEPAPSVKKLSGRKLLLGSSYLMMLLGLVMIAKISSTIVDNQFNAAVEMAIEGRDSRTAFYGGFFSFLNGLSFVMQFFVTSFILRVFGVGISLWILPVGLLIGGAASVLYPVLLTGIYLKAFDGSVNYSIQQAAREVLYLPVSGDVRYRVKPINDMLGYRVAKSLGGLYIALAAPFFSIPDQKLSVLILILLPLWFFMAWKMRHGYSAMLRQNLLNTATSPRKKETRRISDILSERYDEKTLESMKVFLRHPSTYDRKLSAVACSLYLRGGAEEKTGRKRIEEIIRREAIEAEKSALDSFLDKDLEFLEKALMNEVMKDAEKKSTAHDFLKDFPEDALIRLGDILRDPQKSLEAKRKAVRITQVITRQETVDLLFNVLSNSENQVLRFVIVRALRILRRRNDSLIMNRFLIKSEISKEVKICLELKKLSLFYERHRKQAGGEEYSIVLLKALTEESVERIFHFLELLYPPEMIEIVYDRIADPSENKSIRSHAIELLNNSLDPDVLALVQKALDEHESDSIRDADVTDLLSRYARHPDQWLRLLSVILISELKLNLRWPALGEILKREEAVNF